MATVIIIIKIVGTRNPLYTISYVETMQSGTMEVSALRRHRTGIEIAYEPGLNKAPFFECNCFTPSKIIRP